MSTLLAFAWPVCGNRGRKSVIAQVHTQREICQWEKSNDKSQIENQFTKIENKPRPKGEKCSSEEMKRRRIDKNKLKGKLCVQI